ncbi:hypothetical protein [Streptomyces cinnamoneus]|uniref:PLL-like beta propeller domain-containing protein n=1 Tax=Streptomyces cinnamoneus TaxID=53446 RepID=A0A918TR20_STRCJ|nr:hypothetical protein [Streptomyces cinnamoneus]GHC59367.1 hypothetical protein GCM10010507_40450 [Streptomyces cinnamoneus]
MALAFLRRRALTAGAVALAASGFVGVVATAPAQASTCSVQGHGGAYICEYGKTTVTFPNGQQQIFVIGTDYAVWTTYNYENGDWSSWESMSGSARSGVSVTGDRTWEPTITVTGTDGNKWSRHRLDSGAWTSWTRR